MTYRLELRTGTSAQWDAANPVLAEGEPGWDSTTPGLKVGDGVTAWTDLDYVTTGDGGGAGTVTSVNGVAPNVAGNVVLVPTNIGLGNVNNTSDATKNGAVATLTNKTISGINNTLSGISVDSIPDMPDFALSGQTLCYVKWTGTAYPNRSTSGTVSASDIVVWVGGPGPALSGTGSTGAVVGDWYVA